MPPSTTTLALVLLASGHHARADVGVEAGARIGVDFEGDEDMFVGADLRLAFPSSPLTINPTFDYHFVADGTMFQVGANALYHPPLSTPYFRPYVGVGFGVTRFAINAANVMPGQPVGGVEDNEGIRGALNLVAGARFDLPALKPYTQAMLSTGDIDLYTISVGVLTDFGCSVAAPAETSLAFERTRLLVSPYLQVHLAGDVEAHRGGAGGSVGYYRGILGFEVDAAVHGHFFKDKDVAHVVPDPMIDLNTRSIVVTGNVVAPYHIRRAGLWTPYAIAGLGIVHAIFDAVGADRYDTTQNNLLFDAGAGVMHALTRHVGFRVDLRYFHAFVDEDARTGGYFKDYDFLRVSVGLTFGLGL